MYTEFWFRNLGGLAGRMISHEWHVKTSAGSVGVRSRWSCWSW